MKALSIRSKLLTFTALIIALSVLGVGYLINSSLLSYHRDTARREIQAGFGRLNDDIQQITLQLVSEANAITEDERIIASMSLISNYQDPANYNSVLFDEQKKSLSSKLLSVIRAGSGDEAFLYSNSGELSAFAMQHEETHIRGFTTYVGGQQTFILMNNHVLEDAQKQSIINMVTARMAQHRQDKFGIDYHNINHILLAENQQPVLRRHIGGNQEPIGQLVLANRLDSDFIRSSTSPPTSFGIIDDSMQVLVASPGINQLRREQINDMHAYEGGDIIYFEAEQGFIGARHMRLNQDQHVHLISMYPMSAYLIASKTTRWAVVTATLVTSLIVIPLGIILLQRLFNRPLEQLMTGVERLRSGDYETPVSVKSKDELGELAQALTLMADGIRERESDLNTLIEHIPMMLFVKDAKTLRFIRFNRAGEKLLGKSREELIGRSDHDFFPKEQADFFTQKDREVLSSGMTADIGEEYIDTHEGRRILHTRKVPILNTQGQARYLLGVSEDITEHKQSEEKIRQWAKVFDSTSEGIIITDLTGTILDVNDAFTEITGFSKQEVTGNNPRLFQSGRHDADFYTAMWQTILRLGTWRGEIWNRRKNGELFPSWETISTVYNENGEATHYVSVFTDISPIKETQEQLDFLAHHDPLTGLPNRLLLNDRMQHAIDRASRNNTGVAVMFLDLDRFKVINDSMGHPAGDELLLEVSRRLQNTLREVDTISRQGGDEFILLLEDFVNTSSVLSGARKVLTAFTNPFHVAGRELIVTASLGISIYPEDSRDAAELIRNADAAMYRAKEYGRNQFWFYTEDITRQAEIRVDMEQALRDALAHGELELYYQPQIDLARNKIMGVEALIRWDRPGIGFVLPGDFIPLAEETGLIIPIGEWVLYSACRQMRHWLQEGLKIQRMAINISPIQISRSNLPDLVEDALRTTGLAAELLELEVTEAVFMHDTENAGKVFGRLDKLGVHLALDDFGTGFSSLSYLKDFRFDRLKIDRSFISGVLDKANDQSIASSIITLGHSLGMDVLAEGIENREQLQWLRERGCNEGQGYLFSRPVEASEIQNILRQGLPAEE